MAGWLPAKRKLSIRCEEFSDPGAEPPMLAEPEGIALDWRGNIYVSNRKGDGVTMLKNEIIKITPMGYEEGDCRSGFCRARLFRCAGIDDGLVGQCLRRLCIR